MFNTNSEGNLVGYHVEGGETLELCRTIPLSVRKKVIDTKPLFLGYDPVSWFPFHLNPADYKILEITFKPPKIKEFFNMDEYSNLFNIREYFSPIYRKDVCSTTLSAKGKKLVKEGYDLFCLNKNLTINGQDDILEAALLNGNKYVKDIKEINVLDVCRAWKVKIKKQKGD